MTTYELRHHLSELLDSFSIERIITKYIFVLSRGYEQIGKELTGLLYIRNRAAFSKQQQEAQDKFYELRQQSDTFPLGQIFHEAITMQQTLESLEGHFELLQDQAIKELRLHVDHFYKGFETFARAGDERSFAVLIQEAGHLYRRIIAARQFFTTMIRVLTHNTSIPAEQAQLSVLFGGQDSITALTLKVNALNSTYEEICGLTGSDPKEFPLEIVKVEAPDLWVCVRGERAATLVVKGVLERYVTFLYSRFSGAEGVLDISERVISTQALVTLTDELERAGIKIDQQRLQRTALTLRRDLIEVLVSVPVITIDDIEYAVDEGMHDEYVAESQRLLPTVKKATAEAA